MKIAGIDNSMNSAGLVKFELDEKFDIIDYNYYVIKCNPYKKSDDKKTYNEEVKNGVIYLKPFVDNMDRFIRKGEFICDLVKDCEYVSLEDYSFGSVSSSLTNISENTGYLKILLYKAGIKLRKIEAKNNKKFFTKNGNADKVAMIAKYIEDGNFLNIDTNLKEFDYINAPKQECLNDIVDAYSLCEFLRTEIKLRHGLLNLKELPLSQIELFNKVRKDSGTNILDTEFTFKK